MLIESFDDIYTKDTPSKELVIPESIKNSISDQFLIDFRDYLVEGHDSRAKDTYHGYFGWLSGTALFYSALEKACEKNNDMYLYHIFLNTDWFIGDAMDDKLAMLLVERDIIEMGTEEDWKDLLTDDERMDAED